MTGNIQVPTALSGVITRLQGISYCMDNATHLIHTVNGATRLSGNNEEVTKVLNDVADGNTQVMVMGYPVWGPECMHVSVYHIAPVSDVIKVLSGENGGPFPWKTFV